MAYKRAINKLVVQRVVKNQCTLTALQMPNEQLLTHALRHATLQYIDM